MTSRRLRLNNKGQFVILVALGVVIIMVSFSALLAQTSISPLDFPRTNFREAATQIGTNLRQALAISLAEVTKELKQESDLAGDNVSLYLEYAKMNESDSFFEINKKGYESLTKWQNITLQQQRGQGLSLSVSNVVFRCDWTSSKGYSKAEADMSFNLLSYGFYGWQSIMNVELNLTIMGYRLIDEQTTSFWFNLIREQGEPVCDLNPTAVLVSFQESDNFVSQESFTLAHFGDGRYLLTCGTCVSDINDVWARIILQDTNGIFVGAYSRLEPINSPGPIVEYPDTQILPSEVKISSSLTNIIAAEYFIGTFGIDGTGTQMSPSDGAWDSPTENVTVSIDTTGWPIGEYTIYIHGKDSEGNWGPPRSYKLLVGPKMHIKSIELYWQWSGGSRYVRARVTVVDSQDNPVRGARVGGYWSGRITATDSGYTDYSGGWTTNRQRARYSGTYTFTVDKIVLSGWIYDSAANVETSDSISF